MIDQRELIGHVAAKNGIRLEPDDPAFALVTLNEAVLQDASAALTQDLRQVLNSFTESLAKTQHRAGKALAQDVKTAAAELRRELNSDIEKASLKANELVVKVSAANGRPAIVKWAAVSSAAALLMFLCGVIVGLKIVEH
jgi:Transcriptional activator TraM